MTRRTAGSSTYESSSASSSQSQRLSFTKRSWISRSSHSVRTVPRDAPRGTCCRSRSRADRCLSIALASRPPPLLLHPRPKVRPQHAHRPRMQRRHRLRHHRTVKKVGDAMRARVRYSGGSCLRAATRADPTSCSQRRAAHSTRSTLPRQTQRRRAGPRCSPALTTDAQLRALLAGIGKDGEGPDRRVAISACLVAGCGGGVSRGFGYIFTDLRIYGSTPLPPRPAARP